MKLPGLKHYIHPWKITEQKSTWNWPLLNWDSMPIMFFIISIYQDLWCQDYFLLFHWHFFIWPSTGEYLNFSNFQHPASKAAYKFEKWKFSEFRGCLTSATSASSKRAGGYFQWLHFWNQWLPLIEMNYRLSYFENFHFTNFQHPTSKAANKFE